MMIWDLAWNWNATTVETQDTYPCDKFIASEYRGMFRAIDVRAPANTVFRWICQLKIAPYSYDWIDNGGRQSPRQLTPGAERLEIGQNLMVFRIVEFEVNRQITGVLQPEAVSIFGRMALTYVVQPTGPASCRLVVKVDAGACSGWERIRRFALAWGDLIMMRKQLLTIKELAEGDS
jgi:hypothetical protein